jgi:AraC-like DNA-binding protein
VIGENGRMAAPITAEAMSTRVVRHCSQRGRWEMAFGMPDPHLGAHVQGSYVGYVEAAVGPMRRQQVPFAGVPLIISFGPTISILDPHDPAQSQPYCSFVAGLYDHFVVTEYSGVQHGVEVIFTPIGAARFLGLPLGELVNRVIDLDDILGSAARRLAAQLAEAPGWSARFALLDRFILARLSEARPVAPFVAWAWEQLVENDGARPIGALAAEIGCSRKHLIHGFRAEFGLPPKTMARLLRFQRATDLIKRDSGVRWAELALACGYYDQAHLIRDFREFADSTPVEFLRRHLPDSGGVAAV